MTAATSPAAPKAAFGLTGASHNLTGIVMMSASMVLFAFEDAMIKLASVDLPTGQVILLNCLFGMALFGTLAVLRRERPFARAVWTGLPLLRSLAEVVNTAFYVTALALIPLSTSAAILQAAPILITAAAAIFFGEQVGWRRWTAIVIGLIGVLIILRPGSDAFQPAALLAVASTVTLAARELLTRRIPPETGGMPLAFSACVGMSVLGLVMMQLQGGWVSPDLRGWAIILGVIVSGSIGYTLVIGAARTGEVAVVTPFRYVRLPFAMLIALPLFGEWPDHMTLIGSALVIGTGLYTLYRERKKRRQNA